MPWVDVNGHDIYYHEEGSGQPIVFLHGMTSCGEAWFQQFEAFRDRFRVIAYDSVNHGHSSNSPRDEPEPDRADELEGFLAALGIERPILAGNSMGGGTLLRWAARHPDDAVALIPSGSGVARPGPAAERQAGELARRLRQPIDNDTIFLPFGDSLTERLRTERPVLYDRYYRIRSTATRIEALRHPRTPTAANPSRAELADAVVKVASPMLVVVGSLDRALPSAEHLHELVPGSRLAVIEGAPHNVYWEAAAEYNEAVSKFLADVV
ncbi:MAG TPA: alpha/beta hydrolase [Acidimicrobiales bacterium]|nr:alpha/beta hydrolase [Acidimicrobiales bacterium]